VLLPQYHFTYTHTRVYIQTLLYIYTHIYTHTHANVEIFMSIYADFLSYDAPDDTYKKKKALSTPVVFTRAQSDITTAIRRHHEEVSFFVEFFFIGNFLFGTHTHTETYC
jgi:hypothetical protein